MGEMEKLGVVRQSRFENHRPVGCICSSIKVNVIDKAIILRRGAASAVGVDVRICLYS
jgi:hypothetical protein